MKDAVMTIRLPRATRKRIEELAKDEGRSLSQQVERLLDDALTGRTAAGPRARARSTEGVLAGGRVPTLADFRKVRRLLSASLDARIRGYGRR